MTLRALSAFSRPLRYMPQLTLFADPRSKSLSLSPQKPKATTSTNHTRAASGSGFGRGPCQSDQPDLRESYHIQEDMAANHKSRAKPKAEGKDVKAEEPVDKKEHGEELHVNGDEAKGQPAENGKKRSRSPEGGGVAGSRDTKRHKNAYEISKCMTIGCTM